MTTSCCSVTDWLRWCLHDAKIIYKSSHWRHLCSSKSICKLNRDKNSLPASTVNYVQNIEIRCLATPAARPQLIVSLVVRSAPNLHASASRLRRRHAPAPAAPLQAAPAVQAGRLACHRRAQPPLPPRRLRQTASHRHQRHQPPQLRLVMLPQLLRVRALLRGRWSGRASPLRRCRCAGLPMCPPWATPARGRLPWRAPACFGTPVAANAQLSTKTLILFTLMVHRQA